MGKQLPAGNKKTNLFLQAFDLNPHCDLHAGHVQTVPYRTSVAEVLLPKKNSSKYFPVPESI